MSFGVHRNRAIRVPAHGDLVRLNETYLPVLVEDTERVALGLEDDTNCLLTVWDEIMYAKDIT